VTPTSHLTRNERERYRDAASLELPDRRPVDWRNVQRKGYPLQELLRIFRVSLLHAVLLTSGCGLLLDAEPRPDASAGGDDSAMMDAFPDDVPEMDTTPVLDAMPGDVPRPMDVSVDASVDASFGCVFPGGSDVVAHYTFDTDMGSQILDETGAHHGTTENAVSHVDGRCGQALTFQSGMGIPHAHIRDHADFDLMEGSLSLFVRVPAHDSYGIISRDWQGVEEPGHFGIYTSYEGHVVVRLQDIEIGRGGFGSNAVWLCSDRPLRVGEWEHVGVSWGGDQDVQLWLGGEPATLTDELPITWYGGGATIDVPCGTTIRPHGIDGNSLSWILGANASLRSTSLPNRLFVPFIDGAIDELRILRVRRDFTRP